MRLEQRQMRLKTGAVSCEVCSSSSSSISSSDMVHSPKDKGGRMKDERMKFLTVTSIFFHPILYLCYDGRQNREQFVGFFDERFDLLGRNDIWL
jgi:hypothetical protein